ncbi:MAG: DUF349 domain-containing protein [Cryomorphaceae bacterium]|nr:DUF349 domain-containing protein [Cryomorphaceae bacterium]
MEEENKDLQPQTEQDSGTATTQQADKDSAETAPEEAVENADAPEEQPAKVKVADSLTVRPAPEELYANMNVEALLKEGKKLLGEENVFAVKAQLEYIRDEVKKQLDKVLNEKKEAFINEGGNEIDFEYNQPERDTLREIYREYRAKRKARQEAIQKEQEANLDRKKDIIEEIKALAQREESLGETFPAFRALQEAWKNTGPVPKSEMNELYRNYHFYVEAFYDYVQINRELRDLDFKKNKEIKEKLIEKADKLSEETDVINAMRTLQKLHKQWKETGPVERELREDLWEKFSAATKVIHDKRDAFEEERKQEAEDRIAVKAKICELLEDIDLDKVNSHKLWQKTMKTLDEANAKYKAAGYAKHPDNDTLWERFREVNRKFHRAKNAFYKEMKQVHQENLEAKKALIEKAEALKDSEDFKETANTLKKLQSDWRKIGPVARKDSDKIWHQFRSACDHFFNRMKDRHKEREVALEGNLEEKKKLLEELKTLESADKNMLMDLLKRWKDVGPVPASQREIEFEWNKLVDVSFEKIDMNKMESSAIRYRAKVETMKQSEGMDKLQKEQQFLRQKMDEARRELSQLEENMARVTGSSDNPFMKEIKKNLRHREEQVALLKVKLQIVKEMMSPLQKG